VHLLFKGPTNSKFFNPQNITGITGLDKAHWVIIKSYNKAEDRYYFHNPFGKKDNHFSLPAKDFLLVVKKTKGARLEILEYDGKQRKSDGSKKEMEECKKSEASKGGPDCSTASLIE
jgi:hypothetical protein